MKKVLLAALILLLSVSLFACTGTSNGGKSKENPQQTDEADKKAVANLVEGFGSKLQTVSLLAPIDLVKKSMQESYSAFVSQELLSKWEAEPLKAPGRMTSSPWPDRIDISSIEKSSENTYEVKGEIIEITSNEKEKGGYAAKRPITLSVKRFDGHWLIDEVSMGQYEENRSVNYINDKYGFSFSLPEGWKGYSIVAGEWEGLAIGGSKGEKVVEKGPIISIRHPMWTSEKPRQDIPIMIFTQKQWNMLQEEKFHIGAAPIGPSELGRNTEYVFALPARYNFAFPEGYEEVESILKGNPLKPIEK